MSPVDVMTMVKKLEQRTSAVEQILPTLATKEDLKGLCHEGGPQGIRYKGGPQAFALVLHED